MDPSLSELLRELEDFGKEADRNASEHTGRMLNITADTGVFLGVLVRATRARDILEIGTSNGYSTLWLANAAAANGGHVSTVERSVAKLPMATDNFTRSGLASFITLHPVDASSYLEHAGEETFDLIFLDSDRTEYSRWWPHLQRLLRPGGLLIVDNAISHSAEMQPFRSLVEENSNFDTSLVPVGKGEFLAVKIRQSIDAPIALARHR